jgi:hypothetical protein
MQYAKPVGKHITDASLVLKQKACTGKRYVVLQSVLKNILKKIN